MPQITRYSPARIGSDHFEPCEINDPKSQRQMHAKLELIDYTAYMANRKEVAKIIGEVDAGIFEKLAAVTARARCHWLKEALLVSLDGKQPADEQIKILSELRVTYDEMTAAYDGLRRLVERGYIAP